VKLTTPHIPVLRFRICGAFNRPIRLHGAVLNWARGTSSCRGNLLLIYNFTFAIWWCIQKFPDWVDNEMYAYKNKHSLRTNTKRYGDKTHYWVTHKIAIHLHLMVENCTVCSSRCRRPVRKLLGTPSCVFTNVQVKGMKVKLSVCCACLSTHFCCPRQESNTYHMLVIIQFGDFSHDWLYIFYQFVSVTRVSCISEVFSVLWNVCDMRLEAFSNSRTYFMCIFIV
jgi:hypothetical protein